MKNDTEAPQVLCVSVLTSSAGQHFKTRKIFAVIIDF